jgi:hydrogenase maturation protein HypF
MIGTKIHITGIVQGVGFRPFIYNQAIRQGLTGWVCNTSAGVDIEINGEPEEISAFIQSIKTETPPLARIDSIEYRQITFIPRDEFKIVQSIDVSDAFQPISPDICICQDCYNELFDPANRRYRYPFINCTNCGPRLTIIEDIPYDRPNTTMKDFVMCPDCQREYYNPGDRRFHAQPIACPVCGPQVWLEHSVRIKGAKNSLIARHDDAIIKAQEFLIKGNIVGVKGLGGFHLACDATNRNAVAELRRRKLRVDKPFAVMMADMKSISEHVDFNNDEMKLLESRERPIVILKRKEISNIVNDVSPRQNTLGVMLPYTPLHYLLFSSPDYTNGKKRNIKKFPPLVMTSGNLSEEPIATSNEEARLRLSSLADVFLMHDRPIRTRCDDSVMRNFQGVTIPLRRSRGYAPYPIHLKLTSPQVLAVGAELKNSFCITRERYAFLSHHIGDLENVETYDSLLDGITHYESLFRFKPEAIAHDLHPNYLATRYAIDRAEREGIPLYDIQHHHAHIVSCMVENTIASDQPVIGVAFDGTGYGEDGAIWGGEFLLSNYHTYKRVCHLNYIPLPGGDASIRKPARIALAYLWSSKYDWEPQYKPVSALCLEELQILKSQLEMKINTPFTSSMGRFFDAISAIAGVREKINYEAQAAIEFESLADPNEKGEYSLLLEPGGKSGNFPYIIDTSPVVGNVLTDYQNGIPVSTISARFHNGIARMVGNVCKVLRCEFDTNDVILSGGVWQNMTLLHLTHRILEENNFKVYIHRQVPTNDGGISLGQAIIAQHRIMDK